MQSRGQETQEVLPTPLQVMSRLEEVRADLDALRHEVDQLVELLDAMHPEFQEQQSEDSSQTEDGQNTEMDTQTEDASGYLRRSRAFRSD